MRHDDQRPQLIGFAAEAPVPGYGIDVLAQMRANPLTRVRIDEFRAEAAHIVIVAPSAKVVDACFSEVLGAVRNRDSVPESPPDVPARSVENLHPGPGVEVLSPDRLTVEAIADVPGGTWVFLPHRHDGWTDLEAASARLRALLVKENTARPRDAQLTLIEYGVNLWLWAESPHSGGDPVCHAGELISWESAWALVEDSAASERSASALPGNSAAVCRPPIYFGLPPLLRARRLA